MEARALYRCVRDTRVVGPIASGQANKYWLAYDARRGGIATSGRIFLMLCAGGKICSSDRMGSKWSGWGTSFGLGLVG